MTLTFAPRSDTEEFRDTGLCRASCPLGVCSVCLMWERGPGTAQFLLCSPRGGGGGWGGEFRPSSGHLAAGTGPPCSQASSPACFALRNPSNPQPHSFYLRSGPPCFGQNHLRFCLLHFVWCKRQGADGILLTDGEETKSLQSLLCFLYVKTEFLQKGHAGLRGVRSQQRRTRHLLSKGVWAVRPR